MKKVGRPKKLNKPEIRRLNLNVPADLLEEIDYILHERMINMPRHTWILEAMREKAKKEIDIIESGEKL